jgi:Short C-terminal domain
MGDPARGTANVVSSTDYRPELGQAVSASGSWRCTMTCVLQADGVPAQSVHFAGDAPTLRWPWPGTVLPITVDRANLTDWVIHWDEVPTSGESNQADADALAASMRGEGGGDPAAAITGLLGGLGSISDATVIDTRNDPAMREQILGMLSAQGVDVQALRAQAAASAQGLESAAPEPTAPDPLDRLEKLGQLHSSGVLTDAEFAAQKAKILGT